MERHYLDEAVDLAKKATEALAPDQWSDAEARQMLRRFARLGKLAAFGEAAAAARLSDPRGLARESGTSVGKARRAVKTATAAEATPAVSRAMRAGELSLDEAKEIVDTESVAPGSAGPLLARVKGGAPFHVLRDEARKRRLAAQDGSALAERQHEARYLRHGITDDGMIRLEAELEPHVGTPLINRLRTEAKRLSRKGKAAEPFERYLADALPRVASGTANAGQTEMVVLVSSGVADRGWEDVRSDEHCKIPGIGPIAPETARRIAEGDAFLTGLFFDGDDLRHIRRFGRRVPAAVKAALNLGNPPDFDGRQCVDCGNRFFLEADHREPRASGGETALDNLEDRCDPCHDKKTRRDREAGLLREPRALANAPP